jgi:hypothetical protein
MGSDSSSLPDKVTGCPSLVEPVAPVRFRHVLRFGRITVTQDGSLVKRNALEVKKDFNNRFIIDQFDPLADVLIRNTVLGEDGRIEGKLEVAKRLEEKGNEC